MSELPRFKNLAPVERNQIVLPLYNQDYAALPVALPFPFLSCELESPWDLACKGPHQHHLNLHSTPLSWKSLANLICKGVTNCWHNTDGICAGNISSEHSLCWWSLHKEFAHGCFFRELFVCVFPALLTIYPKWCLFLWRWSQCLCYLPPPPSISFPLFLCLSVSLIQFGVVFFVQVISMSFLSPASSIHSFPLFFCLSVCLSVCLSNSVWSGHSFATIIIIGWLSENWAHRYSTCTVYTQGRYT